MRGPFLPGEVVEIRSPIDMHTHCREPGGEDMETIETATLAALAGGYRGVCDMPNNPDGMETRTVERMDGKQAIAAEDSHTEFGTWAGFDLENPKFEEFGGLVVRCCGGKLYMGPTQGNLKVYDLDAARPTIDGFIREARSAGVAPPLGLHALGEIGAETAGYIARNGYPTYWCHLSTAEEVRYATQLKKKYPEHFSSETTLHHMTMTSRDADMKYGWLGGRMQPKLGDDADADAVVNAFNRGIIDTIGTDHAPHLESKKLSTEESNPKGLTEDGCETCYGISGIEFVLPVAMRLVQEEIISMERLEDALYHQPVRILGLKEGLRPTTTRLEIGPYRISEDDIVGMSRNTPYVNWTAWARVMGVERGDRAVNADNNWLYRPLKYGAVI